MTDGRERRKAKQIRRNQRRARRQRAGNVSEALPLAPALAPPNPVNPWSFLVYASMQAEAVRDDPMAEYRSHQHGSFDFDYLITNFMNAPTPVSADLVALFADLLDGELQLRYRDALAAYSGPMSRLIAAPRDIEALRAVRISHVLGDYDRVLIAVRLHDGEEATCAVLIDHLDDSESPMPQYLSLPSTVS